MDSLVLIMKYQIENIMELNYTGPGKTTCEGCTHLALKLYGLKGRGLAPLPPPNPRAPHFLRVTIVSIHRTTEISKISFSYFKMNPQAFLLEVRLVPQGEAQSRPIAPIRCLGHYFLNPNNRSTIRPRLRLKKNCTFCRN